MEGLCADKTQQLVDITDWIVDTKITVLRDNNRPKPGGNVTFGELLTSSVLTAGVWVLMLVWNARTSVGLFKKDGLLAAHDEEPANYFQGHGCVVDFELKLEECQLKQYQWEQEQMASMKEYIARFGPGSAKLVRGIKQPWPPPRAVPPRLDYIDDEASVGSARTRLYPLTKKRAKPAVPLGANYRLIDIPVSSSAAPAPAGGNHSPAFSFSIWPPTQRTRDAVVRCLVETLAGDTVLCKRYGAVPVADAEPAARAIETEAFDAVAAAGGVAASVEEGNEALQSYSKEVSHRLLDFVKSRSADAKADPPSVEALAPDAPEPSPRR
uniref:WPP domain-containing protein n=1 Tax=Zea mays TaxID=4577 RepID=A0A804QLU9_MAIZE